MEMLKEAFVCRWRQHFPAAEESLWQQGGDGDQEESDGGIFNPKIFTGTKQDSKQTKYFIIAKCTIFTNGYIYRLIDVVFLLKTFHFNIILCMFYKNILLSYEGFT